MLDDYERLHVAAPQVLDDIAKKWKVTASDVESAAKKHSAAVSKLVEEITGIAKKSQEELQEAAKVTVEAFSHIRVSGLTFEELEKAQAKVQEVIDEFSQAGQSIPDDLAKIGSQLGAFQNGADIVSAKCKEARVSMDSLAAGAQQVGDASAQAAGEIDKGSAAVAGYSASAKEAGETTLKVSGSLKEGTLSIVSVKAGAGEATEGVKKLGDHATDAGSKVAELGDKAATAREQLGGVAEDLEAAARAAMDLAGVIIDFSQPVEQVQQLVAKTKDLQTELKGVKTELAGLPAAIETAFSPALAQLDAVIAKLAAVRSAAQETVAALDSVAEAA
jgi:chromosome segregation ATPase